MSADEKESFAGITARCYDPESGEMIGPPIPGGRLDCSSLDARYIHKMNYERWGLGRTEIAKKYLSEEIEGHFYPETIVQDECARRYKERYIDVALRGYYSDTDNAITKTGLKVENYYLWLNNVNDNMDYFRYDPFSFHKSFVGISMTGFAKGMSVGDILKDIKCFWAKMVTLLFVPLGYILMLKKKKPIHS